MNSLYPAVAAMHTIMNDADLIEIVRSDCGSQIADLLEERLGMRKPANPAHMLEELRNGLGDIESGLNTVDSVLDMLEED
jgi:hypothetical protein